MNANTGNYLRIAGNLIKGDLAEVNQSLKEGRQERNDVLWKVLVNLLCYAQNEVFHEGYTKKLASQFKRDVAKETGLSEKQASKYTEAISAGLGVRGVRKGLVPIEGLPAVASESPEAVMKFLNAAEITTFNKFIAATRTDATPVQKAALILSKLTLNQRQMAMDMAKRNDTDADTDDA